MIIIHVLLQLTYVYSLSYLHKYNPTFSDFVSGPGVTPGDVDVVGSGGGHFSFGGTTEIVSLGNGGKVHFIFIDVCSYEITVGSGALLTPFICITSKRNAACKKSKRCGRI